MCELFSGIVRTHCFPANGGTLLKHFICMKQFLFLIVSFFIFTQCASTQKTGNQGFLHCPQNNYSFGTLAFAAPAEHKFMCINTGTQALKIINIRTTCGCTIPQWDKNEIAPGDTTYVTIQYDSRRSGEFLKEIIVYPNTKQKELSLYVSGKVLANPNKFIID